MGQRDWWKRVRARFESVIVNKPDGVPSAAGSARPPVARPVRLPRSITRRASGAAANFGRRRNGRRD